MNQTRQQSATPQEAIEILDKGGELLGTDSVELKIARRVVMVVSENR